ncbi:hypothetical protein HAX54_005208, partial [Datura stramonium]|nr:hypothetical protein [Datura stramonium]
SSIIVDPLQHARRPSHGESDSISPSLLQQVSDRCLAESRCGQLSLLCERSRNR